MCSFRLPVCLHVFWKWLFITQYWRTVSSSNSADQILCGDKLIKRYNYPFQNGGHKTKFIENLIELLKNNKHVTVLFDEFKIWLLYTSFNLIGLQKIMSAV